MRDEPAGQSATAPEGGTVLATDAATAESRRGASGAGSSMGAGVNHGAPCTIRYPSRATPIVARSRTTDQGFRNLDGSARTPRGGATDTTATPLTAAATDAAVRNDGLVPSQWWAGRAQGGGVTPERRLLLAILDDAIALAIRYGRWRPWPDVLQDAVRWMQDPDGQDAAARGERYPVTFRMCCELGLSVTPDAVVRQVARRFLSEGPATIVRLPRRLVVARARRMTRAR